MTLVEQWQMSGAKKGVLGSTRPLRLTAGAGADVARADRRQHRRHDLEQQGLSVDRCDDRGPDRRAALGRLMDLSAGGVRIRTADATVRPDQQIRVRLELPAYAGISPFINTRGPVPAPAREWVGWMTVNRVQKLSDDHFDVAGRLVDMEEMDRGMLGLYLSTQPLAA